jgi:2-phospho-L-lactate guanylyltransferase
VLPEPEPAGLNEAVRAAAAWVQAQGGSAMLVVPGDAPGVSAAEIAHLAAAHARGAAVALVPAHDEGGTNALLLSPPGLLPPAFGDGSFGRHLRAARAAGLAPQVLPLPGLGLDLDHPADLARFASRPSPTHTWRHLAVRAADNALLPLPSAEPSAHTPRGAQAPLTRSPAACPPRAPTAAIS